MKEKKITLTPFPASQNIYNFKVISSYQSVDSKLKVIYDISGPTDKLKANLSIQDTNRILSQNDRKHSLWDDSCFEFFLKPNNLNEYWEMNASLFGQWNFYHLDSYRKNLQQENLITELKYSLQSNENQLSLIIEVELSPLIKKLNCDAGLKLKLGVTSILNLTSDEKLYFALKHCDDKPNFHLEDSFVEQFQIR